jgi:hypothetical protein
MAIMEVYTDFFMYGSGVYQKTNLARGAVAGYHAIRLLGWGQVAATLLVTPPGRRAASATGWRPTRGAGSGVRAASSGSSAAPTPAR